MKKKQLEMLLERVEGFSSPSAEMEQYPTPAPLAAALLHLAYMRGELEQVVDLGCGTGVLAIGAALLGARAAGVEVDPRALAVARRNASRLKVHVDFIRADVGTLALKRVGTVVMNPPFGAQKASPGDRAFLRKAVQIADVIYSIHNAGSEEFIRKYIAPCTVEEVYRSQIPIKRCFSFHSREVREIEVELYRISCHKGNQSRGT
ncbi:MAG: methyltransferase [Methanosarcinales archaeon]|nr:methyltransferase [Methanosarcinales archaeon]